MDDRDVMKLRFITEASSVVRNHCDGRSLITANTYVIVIPGRGALDVTLKPVTVSTGTDKISATVCFKADKKDAVDACASVTPVIVYNIDQRGV